MYKFKSFYKNIINDITTPVLVYLKLRDLFPGALLLESFSFHTQQDNFSIICIDPISEIILDNNNVYYRYPDKCEEKINFSLKKRKNICEILENFMKLFYSKNKYIKYSGLYGYISYDSLLYFKKIYLQTFSHKSYQIPKIRFSFFKIIIIFNNFNTKISIYSQIFNKYERNFILNIIPLILYNKIINFPFLTIKKLYSNFTDSNYKKIVNKSIKACKIGNIFQIVISRQYQQKFKGDEFNVYRSLRSINPSPHLFYFDYGDYKIFGSSPEYQFIIKKNTSYIYPIAGTILRSGEYLKDRMLSKELIKNSKENAEHVMLVDLARNDLNKNSILVNIDIYKKIQYFSHILHIESKISGYLSIYFSPIKIFVESFPAGTLTGAPKYKAMELIDCFENQSRGIYGGSIGFFGFDGQINTAIIIRTFLSKGNTLFIQAGAGIISNSKEGNELQEVNNKLKALNKSIKTAEIFFFQ